MFSKLVNKDAIKTYFMESVLDGSDFNVYRIL